MMTLQERVHGSPPPASWPLGKLHQVFRVRKGHKNIGMQETNLLSLSYGRIIPKDIDTAEGLLPESFETYQIVEPGNIVMRLTDLQNDKRSLRQGLVRERGIITSAYDALEVGRDQDSRFWAYALLALDLAKYFYSLGGGVRQSIKFTDFPNDWIAVPDTATQKVIADFLDRETTRIDQLVERKQRLVGLLNENEQAIISSATCYGLSSNVKFRETHVEWFKKIPSHWTLCRFNRMISEKVDYRGRTPEKLDVGVFLVTARNVRRGRLDYCRAQEFTTAEEWAKLQKRGAPEIGDVIFTTEAPLGEVANVDRTDVAFAQRIMKFRGVSRLVDNYYLKYLMMSDAFQWSLSLFASGSTASGIKSERLAHLYGLMPPVDEQKDIVHYIDAKRSKIYPLRDAVSESIDRLRELRTALITAAVTGQIDVTTWGQRDEADRRLDQIAEEMSGNPSDEEPVEARI